MPVTPSQNFAFLESHDLRLVQSGDGYRIIDKRFNGRLGHIWPTSIKNSGEIRADAYVDHQHRCHPVERLGFPHDYTPLRQQFPLPRGL
jgi:hypothetical protein